MSATRHPTATAVTAVGAASNPSQQRINVGSALAGARILFCTDEWFASSDNLLRDEPPTFDPHAYCAQGKVMDGWESRRRRQAGHDWCIIKLSARARLMSATVDTAYFTGNHVPAISVQAADLTLAQEHALMEQFPGIVSRLLYGGQQGTGCTPSQVEIAETACSSVAWTTVLPQTRLNPGYETTRHHEFTVKAVVEATDTSTDARMAAAAAAAPLDTESNGAVATHVRLNYYPDGGVARLRLWGIPQDQHLFVAPALYMPVESGSTCTVVSHETNPERLPSQQANYTVPQVSCVDQGGVGVSCSNQHYGVPSNLIQAHLGVDMGDGWETARHPNRPPVLRVQPNHSGLVDWTLSDWCILQLGTIVSSVDRIILDTKHFKGNYPESVQVEGCYSPSDAAVVDTDTAPSSMDWFPLLPRGRLSPNAEHCFDAANHQILNASTCVSHVRIHIYPDGGISRVRVYGHAKP